MVDYSTVLALSYFKEKGNKYVISELMEILGYTRTQIDDLMNELFAKDYIGYDDDMIHVSKKGMTFLIGNNYDDLSLNDQQFRMIKIDPNSAVSFDYPYVPEKFTKKFAE